jgi:gluconokinase
MYVIGLDIGTSSTKAVAIEPSGKILVTSQAPYPIFNSAPSVSEQDPELIWEAFIKCVSRITMTLSTPPAAICLSSAMHSVIPVDHAGNPLMNMITWADNRSSAVSKRIRQTSNARSIYENTGTPLHPMSPLSKITWLKESMPDVFNSAHKFISIKEYVWYKLFREYEVDYSIASATGLFNIRELTWHAPALAIAGITTGQLSAPINTTTTRKGIDKTLAESLHIPIDTTFLIGASDGCMANLGSFATHPGIAALTIGTSGAIRVAGKSPVFDFESMPFNYRLDEETYISGGPINNGGVALKWYAESLLDLKLKTQDDYYTLLDPLDETDPGCSGLLFLPYILGERAPIWNSESCGVFFGISAQHKQRHFTRAVVEGITMSLYQIAKTLETEEINIKQINVSGGFVRSEAWVQILADIFGKKVCLINSDDASAIGAAFMGMKTMHLIDTYPIGDSTKIFQPNVERHQKYKNEIFPRFEHLYKALILEMAVLHDHTMASLQTEPNPSH